MWLTAPRLIALAVGLIVFAALLLSAIPGLQSLSPTPTPTLTPSPTPIPSPTATPLAFNVAEEDEILIIVTQFDAQRSSQGYDVSRHIVDGLESNLQTVKVGELRVEPITEVVPDSEAARQLGEVYGATLVIWGWYDNAALTPHYEVIQKEGEIQQVDLGKFIAHSTQPDEFRFYIARYLPRGTIYLSSFTISQIYYSRQKWQDALDFANKAVEIIPEVVESIPEVEASGLENLYLLRGNIYEQLREHEKAIADFVQAIEVNPDHAHAYVGRGAARLNLWQTEAALADLNTAIGLDPKIPLAYYDRGLVHYLHRDYEKALSDFTQAIELDPTLANAYWIRAYVYSSSTLSDTTKAVTDINHFVSMAPNSAVSYAARGGFYIRIDEYDKAEADLKIALEIDPDHLEANAFLGWVYFCQHEYAEAIKCNGKAIDIAPKRADLRFTQAACFLALDQTDQALAENRRAIEINTLPGVAKSAIDDLNELRKAEPKIAGLDQVILDQMVQEIQESLQKLEILETDDS
jgi:tetratricopeptide (TPR) repeat protein